jgi:hypothetical protein
MNAFTRYIQSKGYTDVGLCGLLRHGERIQ